MNSLAWLVLLYPAAWIALALHEGAHALLALTLKFKIFEIRLGSGRLQKVWKWRGCFIRLFPIPYCGWVLIAAPGARWYRLRRAAITAAGPLANAILCAGLIRLGESQFGKPSGIRDEFESALLLVSAWFLLWSVWPRSSTLYGRRVYSDGYRILQLPFLSKEKVYEETAHFYWHQAGQLIGNGEKKRALRLLRKGARKLAAASNWEGCCTFASMYADAGEVDLARTMFLEVLDASKTEPNSNIRTIAGDGLACLALYHDRPDLLPEARGVMEDLVATFPTTITLKGTLGSILVELGEAEKAEALLREVLHSSRSPIDQAICTAYLARIAMCAGDHESARQHAHKATSFLHTPGGPQRLVERLTKPILASDDSKLATSN